MSATLPATRSVMDCSLLVEVLLVEVLLVDVLLVDVPLVEVLLADVFERIDNR
jgi:hypothetical protein